MESNLKRNSNWMFDKKDVDEATHPLAKLLRMIFYKRNITLDKFSGLFAAHGKRLGISNSEVATMRENQRKAILKDHITFQTFSVILYNILHLDIVDIAITFKDDDGNIVTYKNTDEVD